VNANSDSPFTVPGHENNGMPDPYSNNTAPSERQATEQVRTENLRISAIPHLRDLLNAFPSPAVILNHFHQIVAANQSLCSFLSRQEDELLGIRIGESLRCIHVADVNGECGTARFCENCGALEAILNTQRRAGGDVRECTITFATDQGERALDLRVSASSLDLGGMFTVLVLNDISDEKRRGVLEQMFYHDVLNTAMGVGYLLEVLPSLSDQHRQETAKLAFQPVQ
jgi:PAS domain-containing protein